jgi:hypothetical protein
MAVVTACTLSTIEDTVIAVVNTVVRTWRVAGEHLGMVFKTPCSPQWREGW